jgi:hypothetical protein
MGVCPSKVRGPTQAQTIPGPLNTEAQPDARWKAWYARRQKLKQRRQDPTLTTYGAFLKIDHEQNWQGTQNDAQKLVKEASPLTRENVKARDSARQFVSDDSDKQQAILRQLIRNSKDIVTSLLKKNSNAGSSDKGRSARESPDSSHSNSNKNLPEHSKTRNTLNVDNTDAKSDVSGQTDAVSTHSMRANQMRKLQEKRGDVNKFSLGNEDVLSASAGSNGTVQTAELLRIAHQGMDIKSRSDPFSQSGPNTEEDSRSYGQRTSRSTGSAHQN